MKYRINRSSQSVLIAPKLPDSIYPNPRSVIDQCSNCAMNNISNHTDLSTPFLKCPNVLRPNLTIPTDYTVKL